ncbi:MAG: hypothetical protein R2860_06950 [Desulfobacterales bacterium]
MDAAETDRAKRPLMGEIATWFSDLVIITSDNPRTENPTRLLPTSVPVFPVSNGPRPG